METPNTNKSRSLLKRYLSQYFRAKEKQAALRKRLADLQIELQNPGVKSPFHERSQLKGHAAYGSAALTFKISDVKERIQRQIEVETQSVNDIMDILDFLPPESTERDILEYRHIDCKSWIEIQRLVHLTRSPCFEYYNRGLDKLLTYKKVQVILADFEARLNRVAKDSY